jgi:hypothetical protein
LLQLQAEDREFDRLESVFQAMIISLFRSLGYELTQDELP